MSDWKRLFSDIWPPAHTQYMYSTNIVEKVM